MNCPHFDNHRCRSCDWLPIRYTEQLADKQRAAAEKLTSISTAVWADPVASLQVAFRNKAKLAVHGAPGQLILGLPANLARRLGQHDLSDCGLYVPEISAALPIIRAWLEQLAIAPYDIERRSGELKYVLLSAGADQRLLLRLVLASGTWQARISSAMPWLLSALPKLRVLSINLQPVHQAIVEGPLEIVLSDIDALEVRVNDLSLQLMPQSFFQTNTLIAEKLYQCARDWLASLQIKSIWDLYCGVGGFGLHLADMAQSLVGVEINAAAVASAVQAASHAGFDNAQFIAADALEFAKCQSNWPSLVLLNPPRRGVGVELCKMLDASNSKFVLYSSCNPASLAQDLALLPSFTAERAQLFDMFPNTEHAEVLVLLKRKKLLDD
jgi:23S rRNA (uracil747-C5)-methyltransferase